MKSQLSALNFVILAQNHNPAIPTKDWLKNKGIFREDPINFVNTNIFAIYQNEKYSFRVDENSLVFQVNQPKSFSSENIREIKEKIIAYINALPETPYTGIGINVAWDVLPTEPNENVSEFIKAKFIKSEQAVTSLNITNFKSGIVLLFNNVGIQITLQIVPHRISDSFQLQYNFNKNIEDSEKGNTISVLTEFANKIDTMMSQAEEINLGVIGGRGEV